MMFAGLIVLLVGLAVALAATLRIPGYWTPALVGAVLFLVGARRWAIRGIARQRTQNAGDRRAGGRLVVARSPCYDGAVNDLSIAVRSLRQMERGQG